MIDAAELLKAYDQQLRGDSETPSAMAVTKHGPLRLVTFAGGRGFVTYRDLAATNAEGVQRLVAGALAHFEPDPTIIKIEWKTRRHDHAPGLHEALVANGFTPEEPESIMLGEARLLNMDVELPAGLTLRTVKEESDVRAMSAMQDVAFGDSVSDEMADELLRRLSLDDGMELWVAEAAGEIVSAGRLEPVAGTLFAGVWGGATLQAWRGRGIYRALTAARARSALRLGKTLIHSDSTEYSRPILERAGLTKVSTTTPYKWFRGSRKIRN